MDKVISIIVPVYNVEEFLDECVQSIVDQTYENLEIILVDDGSKDNSPALCDAWAKKDSRIKVVHKQNGGLSDARNRGIEEATGDYIYFIDSDDYLDKTMCQRVMEQFRQSNADVVCFGIRRVTETGQTWAEMPGADAKLNREEALLALSQERIRNSACSKVCKRILWDGIRFPVGRMFEDVATTYKLLLKVNTVCCIPDMFYYYRRREGSIVTTMTSRSLRDLFLMQKQVYDDLLPIYPAIAENTFFNLARSAKAYVDHAIYDKSEHEILAQVKAFLQENKAKILPWGGTEFKLYYKAPWLYPLYRRLRQKISK